VDCLTAAALDALAHPDRPVLESRLRVAPPNLGHLPDNAPPPAGKVVYGGNYANHLETANFTINWEEGQGDAEMAARAGESLEAAWTYFVDEHGWTPPVSSDRFYIWVLLVDDLSGTGLTTEYYTDIFPQGYPVIYLNSTWAYDAPFWSSLSEHEFHHSLQFAVRDWSSSEGGAETWYWEASATWAAELVEPETAALDYVVPWYGDRPEVRFDDTDGSHQYGMFVFNGWLEDTLGEGPETMHDVWTEASSAQDATWDTILASATGVPAPELFARFTSAFGNDLYARGPTWQDPARVDLEDGLEGGALYLGARYYEATADGVVTVTVEEGSVLLTSPGTPRGNATSVSVAAGERLAVVATSDPGAHWTLHVSAGPDDTGGTADTGDTGAVSDDSAAPDGDTGGVPSEPGGCACDITPPATALLPLLVAGTIVARRRRSRR